MTLLLSRGAQRLLSEGILFWEDVEEEVEINQLEVVELQDLNGAILFTVASQYLPSPILSLNYLILRNTPSRMRRSCW